MTMNMNPMNMNMNHMNMNMNNHVMSPAMNALPGNMNAMNGVNVNAMDFGAYRYNPRSIVDYYHSCKSKYIYLDLYLETLRFILKF